MKLKETTELQQIANIYKLTTDQVSEIIVGVGIKQNLFADDPIDYGKTISRICEETSQSIFGFMVFAFRKGVSTRILPLFKNLVLIGEGDCPECGSEMTVDTDIANKKTFLEAYCENCKHVPVTNIDVDSMHGGHDDY